MLSANRKGYFNPAAQKLLLHSTFQNEVPAIARQEQFRHRASIAQLALPVAFILWVVLHEPTRFLVFASKVISIKITTAYRFIHNFIFGSYRNTGEIAIFPWLVTIILVLLYQMKRPLASC